MAVIDVPLTFSKTKFDSDQKSHKANLNTLEEFAKTIIVQLVPIGAVLPFTGTSPPAGWLLCDGQAVSRTNYPALFNTIGTAFGVGDGSSTFNVPDLQSASAATAIVPIGAGTGNALGALHANVLSNAATSQGSGLPFNFIIKT